MVTDECTCTPVSAFEENRMTVTTPTRVDPTGPVLAQLVDAASKGFTGSLDVSTTDSAGRALQVSVWLDEGGVYAVHAGGWVPPVDTYAQHRAGTDTPMGVDELDAAQRDWAYGLLAAALTWDSPKIGRTRKGSTEQDTFTPTHWQVVTADVAARVDTLESAWATICESLTTAGIRPVPAAQASGLLAVRIDGSELFDGTESLDQTAGRHGLSRYAVLDELARLLLSGAQPEFLQATPPQVPLMVPEHWEDPARGWGSVDQPAPVAAQDEAPADTHADDPLTGDLPVDRAGEAPEPELDTVPEPGQPEPDSWVQETDEPAVPEAALPDEPLAPVVPLTSPEHAAPASARDLLDAFLGSSTDAHDQRVRAAIVDRLLVSARTEAQSVAAELARAGDELDLAESAVGQCHRDLEAAGNAAAQAQAALDRAEADAQRVRAEYADILAAATQAAQRAADLEARVGDEADELARLRGLVEAQEQVVAVAREDAEVASRAAADARAQVETTAGPVLERADQSVERVRVDEVGPAQTALEQAQARARAATAEVEDAQRALRDAQEASVRAQDLVAYLGVDQAA